MKPDGAITGEQLRDMLRKGEIADGKRSDAHERVLNACINWLCLQMVRGMRVAAWRVDTGRHLWLGPDKRYHVGKPYGTVGAADGTGIIPGGIRFDFDVKIGKDKLSPEQEAFAEIVRSRGGFYWEVRDSVDDLERHFNAAIAGMQREYLGLPKE
jgi:hypothetical protein